MDEREAIRRWVEAWRDAAPTLEALRREEIRSADTAEAIEIFEEAFQQAIRDLPMRTTSGMVEMQALFAKLR